MSRNDDHRSNIPGNIPFISHQHSLTFTRLLPFPGSAFALGTSMSWSAKSRLDPLWIWTPFLESRLRIGFILSAVDSLGARAALFYTDFARMLPKKTKNLHGEQEMKRNICLFLIICLSIASGTALADESGLNANALGELQAAGVDKYLGTSQSFASDFGVWTKHDFNPNYVPDGTYPSGGRPDGPVCIAGTPYSVFTRQGDPEKLLIFLQGGGACSNTCAITILTGRPRP